MSPQIRVAHIINDMEVGGAQTQLANLFLNMDREKFDLRLICLANKGTLGEKLEREGFPVSALGKQGRVHPAMMRRLIRELGQFRPHIVHTTIFTANLWGRIGAVLAGAPIRISHEQSTVSLEKKRRRLLDFILAPFTWKVLAVSDDLRGRIQKEEGLSAQKVEVLYNAIDTKAIQQKAKTPASDLPGRAGRRVGIVGRLEYRKDHTMLIKAAEKVREKMPDVAFLIVGEGPDRAKLAREIQQRGLGETVHLLGERHDVPALLAAFDIYALSSITEGLSLSILEAMAAGCPVVATRVGGNSELLDEGRAGMLTPPRDERAMADVLLQLLKNPEEARQLAQAGQKRAENLFDILPVTRRLEMLYHQACAEKGIVTE